MKTILITGIGTGVGKTVVSAILTKALQGNYWKPIQSGNLNLTDSMKVRKWLSSADHKIFPETYRLKRALSPHLAAAYEMRAIQLERLSIPESERPLIIEGAGGIYVPLNENLLQIELFAHWKIPCILVSKHYLGSINHTLLTIEALHHWKIPLLGIIFNGNALHSDEKLILKLGKTKCLARLHQESRISAHTIHTYAGLWKANL